MVTIDLMSSDSLLVEENSEKKIDITNEDKLKEFILKQEVVLQLITYQRDEE